MTRTEKIKRQIELCRLLCETLCDDVSEELTESTSISMVNGGMGIPNYTRIDNDIMKLRRELLKLGKMTGGRA